MVVPGPSTTLSTSRYCWKQLAYSPALGYQCDVQYDSHSGTGKNWARSDRGDMLLRIWAIQRLVKEEANTTKYLAISTWTTELDGFGGIYLQGRTELQTLLQS